MHHDVEPVSHLAVAVHYAAERDRLSAELDQAHQVGAALTVERGQYRRDFETMSARAADLAVRISDLETQRDANSAALVEVTRERDAARRELGAIGDTLVDLARERNEARTELARLREAYEVRGKLLGAGANALFDVTRARDQLQAKLAAATRLDDAVLRLTAALGDLASVVETAAGALEASR